MHQSCHAPLNQTGLENSADPDKGPLGMCSRKKFREIFNYSQSSGLLIAIVQFIPLVKHEDRALFEEGAHQYYSEHYPDVTYQGFTSFQENSDSANFTIDPQPEEPLYAPLHYVEPVNGYEKAIDLNLLSHPLRRNPSCRQWRPGSRQFPNGYNWYKTVIAQTRTVSA